MFIFDAIIISDLEQKVNVIGLIFYCLIDLQFESYSGQLNVSSSGETLPDEEI